MSILDRFKSSKGKAATGKTPKPKKPAADEAKKQAFANVPTGKTEEPKVKAAKEAGDAKPKTAVVSKDSTWEAHRILLKPVVTEKSSRQAGQYTFEVPITANKIDVRSAVFHVYGVLPVAVNVVRVKGKPIRYGRYSGRTKNRKKAIVTLPAGKTIDVFSA